MATLKQLLSGKEGYFYFVFRVLVGALFLQHGLQKLFGMFGGQAVDLISRMGLAGTIELVVGLLLIFGLLTRLAAFVGILEMAAVYLLAHTGNGLLPIVNKGELALLYLVSFLVLFAYGAHKWGLDSLVLKKKSIKKKPKKKK